MQLQILKKYKSVRPLLIDLPKFTVLTGLNGSGKTQLLDVIAGHKVRSPFESQILHRGNHSNQEFTEVGSLKIGETLITQNLILYVNGSSLIPDESGQIISSEDLYKEYALQKTYPVFEPNSLAKNLAKRRNSLPTTLTIDDFKEGLKINELVKVTHLFQGGFSGLINRYATLYDDNKYTFFKEGEIGIKDRGLTDKEFENIYGQPLWDELNLILGELGVDYRVKGVDMLEFRRGDTYTFLLQSTNGNMINLTDLSSGEKVIFSLFFAMHNAKYELGLPRVLLLDEPDSSLHPQMSGQLIDFLQNILVGKNGLEVIMTTHSPSTIALCPEESIYVVSKTGDFIQKANKDEALKILTVGIPNLSIDYK